MIRVDEGRSLSNRSRSSRLGWIALGVALLGIGRAPVPFIHEGPEPSALVTCEEISALPAVTSESFCLVVPRLLPDGREYPLCDDTLYLVALNRRPSLQRTVRRAETVDRDCVVCATSMAIGGHTGVRYADITAIHCDADPR